MTTLPVSLALLVLCALHAQASRSLFDRLTGTQHSPRLKQALEWSLYHLEQLPPDCWSDSPLGTSGRHQIDLFRYVLCKTAHRLYAREPQVSGRSKRVAIIRRIRPMGFAELQQVLVPVLLSVHELSREISPFQQPTLKITGRDALDLLRAVGMVGIGLPPDLSDKLSTYPTLLCDLFSSPPQCLERPRVPSPFRPIDPAASTFSLFPSSAESDDF